MGLTHFAHSSRWAFVHLLASVPDAAFSFICSLLFLHGLVAS